MAHSNAIIQEAPDMRMLLTTTTLLLAATAARGQDAFETYNAKLMIGPDMLNAEGYGAAVATDGTRLVVGQPGFTGLSQEAVWVYDRGTTAWSVDERIEIATSGDFGAAVALSGNTLAIGAPEETEGAVTFAGAVYIYARQPSGWAQVTRLVSDSPTQNERFGYTLALSDGTLAVGTGPALDSTYVYVRAGSNWTQQAHLPNATGYSLDLSGDTLIVGSFTSSHDTEVYERSGTTWSGPTPLMPPGGPPFSVFYGRSVAIDGDLALVGCESCDDGTGTFKGRVFVFRRGVAGWAHDGEIDTSAFTSGFGYRVFVRRDYLGGRPIAVVSSAGNPYYYAATVEVFGQDVAGPGWTSLDSVIGSSEDGFGAAIALGGGALIIGLPAALPSLFGAISSRWATAPSTPYCTGKQNSEGCTPSMTVPLGVASKGLAPNSFIVGATGAIPSKNGLPFYGLAAAALPFSCSTLCIQPPLRRGPIVQATPGADCTVSSISADLAPTLQADPNVSDGDTIFIQWMMRDPGDNCPDGLNNALSDALSVVVGA